MTKPRTPIARSKPPARVNRKRAAKRKAEAFDPGGKLGFVHSLPCVVASYALEPWPCAGDIEAAHAKSRGAGGSAAHLVPLCYRHHAQQHEMGRLTFAKLYGLNLTMAADLYEALWQAETLYD